MEIIKIKKNNLPASLDALKKSYQLFGPVKIDKQKSCHEFKRLEQDEQPDLDFINTRMSPKAIIYPQSETMFTYSLDENAEDAHILKEAVQTDAPLAVIGIRPCDADAFLLVKRNFDTPDYKDPYWLNAYTKTTLVGLACVNPCSTCFCTTAGSGPFSEQGLDILLADSGDDYLAKVLTAKGSALAKAAGWDMPADPDSAAGDIERLKAAAEEKIDSHVDTEHLKKIDTSALHQAPFWDDATFACINCGTCTYLCPTCWCFDIQDETCGSKGERLRIWDSCMFPLFTMHGTGHNPRGTQKQRVRQRFMHKLKYYVDKYEIGIQCVGCGRCIRACPVNIDIRKICNLMNHFNPGAVEEPESSS